MLGSTIIELVGRFGLVLVILGVWIAFGAGVAPKEVV